MKVSVLLNSTTLTSQACTGARVRWEPKLNGRFTNVREQKMVNFLPWGRWKRASGRTRSSCRQVRADLLTRRTVRSSSVCHRPLSSASSRKGRNHELRGRRRNVFTLKATHVVGNLTKSLYTRSLISQLSIWQLKRCNSTFGNNMLSEFGLPAAFHRFSSSSLLFWRHLPRFLFPPSPVQRSPWHIHW